MMKAGRASRRLDKGFKDSKGNVTEPGEKGTSVT